MKARTVAILAVGVFLLGGACGALYAVLNSNTPSNNDKLPVGSYSDLQNQDNSDNQKDNQDNKDNKDNNSVNNDGQDNSQQGNNDGTNNNEPDNSNDPTYNSDSSSVKTGEVTVREDSALTLRQGPGTNYEKLGQIYRGDSVEILEEQNGWYKVKTYDGVEAWVSAEYVAIVE